MKTNDGMCNEDSVLCTEALPFICSLFTGREATYYSRRILNILMLTTNQISVCSGFIVFNTLFLASCFKSGGWVTGLLAMSSSGRQGFSQLPYT